VERYYNRLGVIPEKYRGDEGDGRTDSDFDPVRDDVDYIAPDPVTSVDTGSALNIIRSITRDRFSNRVDRLSPLSIVVSAMRKTNELPVSIPDQTPNVIAPQVTPTQTVQPLVTPIQSVLPQQTVAPNSLVNAQNQLPPPVEAGFGSTGRDIALLIAFGAGAFILYDTFFKGKKR
jgi:hypothetical protein